MRWIRELTEDPEQAEEWREALERERNTLLTMIDHIQAAEERWFENDREQAMQLRLSFSYFYMEQLKSLFSSI
jgi:hypothetical protein